MHAAFKNIYRIRRSLSLISRETVDYQEEVSTSRNALYLCMSHTFSVFNLFSYNCCLQNMYVLIVDYYVKRVCLCFV